MNKTNTKFIKEITVIDPDSNLEVEVSLFKIEGSGIVGIDSSYLSNTDDDVYNPYYWNSKLEIEYEY